MPKFSWYRQIHRPLIIFSAVIFAAAGALAQVPTSGKPSAEGLRAGAAQVVITPPQGAAMAGYYAPRAAVGTHDDLYAKAIVFEQGGVKVAVVVCDLVSLPKPMTDEARRIIQQKLGMQPDHVMISANHDHTGPVILAGYTPENLEGRMKDIAENYTSALPGKIADAVIQANSRLQAAQVRSAIGEEKSLGFDRRYFMKDGTVGWNPPKQDPNILRPAGPTDPSVPVVYVETPDGKGIAAYVNFAVHQDTTGGLEFSADYSYTLARVLAMAKGPNLVTMFTIGCAGNVNHFDAVRNKQGYEEAARIGAVLAGEVLKTIQRAPLIQIPEIRVSTQFIKLDLPQFTPDEIAWAQRTEKTFGQPNAASFLDLVRATRILTVESRHGKPFDAEVQVIALGDQIAFVSFPGEMFTEFGLTLKEDSPFPITIPAELADGYIGYVPNRQAYPQGAYEVLSSRVLPGAGEMLMNSALSQLFVLFQHLPHQ